MFKKYRFWLLIALLSVFAAGCDRGSEWAGLVKDEDQDEIFVSYRRYVAKVDADGKRAWLYPQDAGDYTFFAEVTLTDDAVYVGDYKGGVHAINRETGEGLWSYEQSGTRLFGIASFGGAADRVLGPLTVGDGVLYVPDEHGLFALDQETGELITEWRLETDRAIWSRPLYIPPQGDQGGLLYVTSLDRHVYAVSSEDGEIFWKTDLEGAIPGAPLFDPEKNILFVGTLASELVALNAENGEVIARFKTRGWVWDAPTFSDGIYYLGDLEGYAYAVRFENNQFEQVWLQSITDDGKLRAAPLVTDNLVVYGSDTNRLYALQREDGEQEWSQPLDGESLSRLITVQHEDETLIVVALANKDDIITLNLENGNKRWTYRHKD